MIPLWIRLMLVLVKTVQCCIVLFSVPPEARILGLFSCTAVLTQARLNSTFQLTCISVPFSRRYLNPSTDCAHYEPSSLLSAIVLGVTAAYHSPSQSRFQPDIYYFIQMQSERHLWRIALLLIAVL